MSSSHSHCPKQQKRTEQNTYRFLGLTNVERERLALRALDGASYKEKNGTL
jgi:hypothetical protein